MYSVKSVFLILLFASFVACSSGGDSNSGNGDTTNTPPVANNVSISDSNGGNVLVGDSLSGNYDYSDSENDSEGQSSYRWLRNNIAIDGATQINYSVVAADLGQSLRFEVTPTAVSGSKTGSPVLSAEVSVSASSDVIFVLDTSASMSDELSSLQNEINNFAASLAAANIDYRIIVLSDSSAFCPPAPLGSGTCPASDNAPNYYQINYTVNSGQVLSAIQSKFAELNTLLRAGSTLHMIVLSDDDDSTSADSFRSFLQAQTTRLGQARLHALVAGSSPQIGDACFGLVAAESQQAIRYAVYSGGQFHDLCDGNLSSQLGDIATFIVNDKQLGVTASYFPSAAYFTQNVALATVDANSPNILNALINAGGWSGNGNFSIDFSLNVETASDISSKTTLTPNPDFYDPDCDNVSVPLPVGGALEGESGYTCASDGDCRLLVWSPSESRLYELYKANYDGAVLSATCLAVWDTSQIPANDGRGESCVSADAAGMSISPLLATADEVAAGEINHALRFMLPNSRQRSGVYLHPATSSVVATGSDSNLPPRGTLLRLRADYPFNGLSSGAKVIARALQRYGMYLVESGNVTLTLQSDKNSTAKWNGLLASNDLSALTVDDFEVMNSGSVINQSACIRTPLSE